MQTKSKMPKVTEQERNDDQQFLKQMGITTDLVYPEHVSTDEELAEIRWRIILARG